MYQKSIKFIRQRIWKYFPNAKPIFKKLDKIKGNDNWANYLLWMCNRIETNKENLLKASRDIGWIFAKMESLDMMTNEDSRNCSRADKEEIQVAARKIYGKE